jgi:gluconokinase
VQIRYVVGVDLGTSGVRAIAFDQALRAVAQASRSYPVHYAAGGIAEQSVADVIEAGEACIREIASRAGVAGRIRALAFCATASSLAAFRTVQTAGSAVRNNPFTPAGPAWLWADNRAASEARRITQHFGARAYQRTGCPVHASYWPAKLLWWREHARVPFTDEARASGDWRLAGHKDYLLYRLTGEWITDRATAAATGLFDSEQGTWDAELLDWLGIEPAWLPRIVPLIEQLPLLNAAAERLNIPATTGVVAGGLDGVLVHLGMGCARAGLASCTIGTSSAVRMSSKGRVTDPKRRTWCYPVVDDLWLAGGAGNNGGNVLTWFHTLCTDMARFGQNPSAPAGSGVPADPTMDQVVALAMQAAPGAEGLLFVPYLFGERSPLWREELTGALVGLSPFHRLPHLARAVLEGISLGAGTIYQALAEQIGSRQEIRAGGGFVASPAWVQLQADVLGAPIGVTATGQETATGAAMLAWHALDAIPLLELQESVVVTQRFTPRPELHELYSQLTARLYQVVQCLAEPISP